MLLEGVVALLPHDVNTPQIRLFRIWNFSEIGFIFRYFIYTNFHIICIEIDMLPHGYLNLNSKLACIWILHLTLIGYNGFREFSFWIISWHFKYKYELFLFIYLNKIERSRSYSDFEFAIGFLVIKIEQCIAIEDSVLNIFDAILFDL